MWLKSNQRNMTKICERKFLEKTQHSKKIILLCTLLYSRWHIISPKKKEFNNAEMLMTNSSTTLPLIAPLSLLSYCFTGIVV